MNYVLKNEQLFIESCRGPDYNRESGITVLFCSNSGGGDLVNVASRSGLIAAVAQFGGLRVRNVFTRVSARARFPQVSLIGWGLSRRYWMSTRISEWCVSARRLSVQNGENIRTTVDVCSVSADMKCIYRKERTQLWQHVPKWQKK